MYSTTYDNIIQSMSNYVPTPYKLIDLHRGEWQQTLSWYTTPSTTVSTTPSTTVSTTASTILSAHLIPVEDYSPNLVDSEYIRTLLTLWGQSTEGDYDQTFLNVVNIFVPSGEWQWYKNDQQFYIYRTFPILDKAIQEYTGYGYDTINEGLRLYPQSCITESINISNGIQAIASVTAVTDQNIVVYRYVDYTSMYEQLIKSDTLILRAYTSTSVAPINTLRRVITDASMCMMEIRIHVGTHCVIVPSDERELILPYNSVIKLIANVMLKDVPYLVFDLLSDGIC